MQNPRFTVRHNFDDPTTALIFNNKGISGKGTEFPSRLYSQTSFEVYLKCFKWDDIETQTQSAYDLTDMDSATILIKPTGTTITATQIGTGVVQGAATNGEVLFTVDSDLIPDNLATYTSSKNRTPITIYLILADSVNNRKISLETAVEIMDIDRDGTENNSALDASGINYNTIQPAKWTARFNEVPVTLERALNLLALEQPTDKGKVIDQLATQPGSPTDGDRYLATTTAGDWTIDKIYEWSDNSVAWLEYTPVEGDEVYDSTLNKRYRYGGAAWAVITVDDGTITTAKLADGAVTQAKLDAGFTLPDGIVTQADLDAGFSLPDGNVANIQLADMQSGTIKGRLTAGAGVPQDLSAAQAKQVLGLDSVDNTTDLDKPTSTATQDALDLKLDATAQAADSLKLNGITLDLTNASLGRVPSLKASLTEFDLVDPSAGLAAGVSFAFNFSTDITATDPTSGVIKFDNATPASVTNIYASTTDKDGLLIDTLFNSLGSGDSFSLKQADAAGNNIRVNVVSVTDNTGWVTINCTVASAGTLPANGLACGIIFDYVSQGGQSGVTSVNGQTGAVTVAQDTDSLTNNSGVTGATTTDALNTLDSGKAASAITITPSGGITSTAADLTAADIGLNLDINGLTAEATPASGDQLIVWDGTQNKKVDWNLLPGAGGGEVNTISSVGGNTSLVSGKVGADLQVKSINFGTNLTVSGVTSTGFTLDAATGTLDTTQVNGWTGQQYFDATTLTYSGTIAWNLNTKQVTELTLTGDATLSNPTNVQDGATYILHVKQDGTGTHNLTFSSNYKFVGDVIPTITSDANHRDVFTFTAMGGVLYGTFVQGFTS